MKRLEITPRFVKYVPEELDEGVLYVSKEYATAVHKCCCGCGNKVVTPISPNDWQLTIKRNAVSLKPSIGNWSFSCRSHYWITNNRVLWGRQFSLDEIQTTRKYERFERDQYYRAVNQKTTWWRRIKRLLWR
jgi:hypothetical protein